MSAKKLLKRKYLKINKMVLLSVILQELVFSNRAWKKLRLQLFLCLKLTCPDHWTKKWHIFLSFICSKKPYIQCHLRFSVVVVYRRDINVVSVGWCYSFPVFKKSSWSTKIYSALKWKPVYFPEMGWTYLNVRLELQTEPHTFALWNLYIL